MDGFGLETFDPRTWINNAVNNAKQSGEIGSSIESFLVELEMKLQLHSEDLDLALEQTSRQALESLPGTLKEVARISGEVKKLRAEAQRIGGALAEAEAKSGPSVAELRDLHQVKTRMEACRDTLKEAASLGQMFDTIDEVFATGNFKAIADTLASMKRSLALLGDVPEFRGSQGRMMVLEDRLHSAVEARLSAVLSDRSSGPAVRDLIEVLKSIQRLESVSRLYIAARLPTLRAGWDAYSAANEPRPVADWIEGFYEGALEILQLEAQWCDSVVPELKTSLLSTLVTQLFRHVGLSLASRLEAFVTAPSADRSPPDAKRIECLTQTIACTDEFIAQLAPVLAPAQGGGGAAAQEKLLRDRPTTSAAAAAATAAQDAKAAQESLSAALRSVAEPLASYLLGHAKIERSILAAEIGGLALGESAVEIEATVRAIGQAVPRALRGCLQSIERSLSLAGGCSSQQVVAVVDDALASLLQRLLGVISAVEARIRRILRRAAGEGEEGGAAVADATRAAIELGDLNGQVLPMLWLLAGMRKRLDVFEARVRTALGDGVPRILSRAREGGDTTVTTAALALAGPAAADALANLAESARTSRGALLGQVELRYRQLQSSVHALVQDTLLARVRTGLQGLAQNPAWAESSSAPPSPLSLAYPLAAVTMVGEYLMGLPQQLDVLMLQAAEEAEAAGATTAAEDAALDDELSAMAASWLDRVAHTAAEMYLGELQRIPALSPAGCSQLSADVEYLTNVLAALGVEPPRPILSWQVLVKIPADSWAEMTRDLVGQGSVEGGTVEAVARARKLGTINY